MFTNIRALYRSIPIDTTASQIITYTKYPQNSLNASGKMVETSYDIQKQQKKPIKTNLFAFLGLKIKSVEIQKHLEKDFSNIIYYSSQKLTKASRFLKKNLYITFLLFCFL